MKNLRACINWLDRKDMVSMIEGIGSAVYESESTEDIRDTLFECVQSGDIDEQSIRDLVE
jgi:hypothetical protein